MWEVQNLHVCVLQVVGRMEGVVSKDKHGICFQGTSTYGGEMFVGGSGQVQRAGESPQFPPNSRRI